MEILKRSRIDCSRIDISHDLKGEFLFQIINRIKKLAGFNYSVVCGRYNYDENIIYLDKSFIREYERNPKVICDTISHETIHMVLENFINDDASAGFDRLLKYTGRYGKTSGYGGI